MIDVIFLLLVFFVCTANFVPYEGTLPTNMALSGTTNHAEVKPDEQHETVRIQVSYLIKPHWVADGKDYDSIQDVRAFLEKKKSANDNADNNNVGNEVSNSISVILDCEKNVPMKDVIDIYDVCRSAGLIKIQFAAKKDTVKDATN